MSGPRNILLTGVPRAGTSLCCQLLNADPSVLALNEPMSIQNFDPGSGRPAAVQRIREFIDDTRRMVLEQGRAPATHVAGRMTDNQVARQATDDGLRPRIARQGVIGLDRQLPPDFTLVVKHNALFTALLPELISEFDVYAIIRNPREVLASWRRVDLPINRGRIPAGEMFDADLRRRLDAVADVEQRRRIVLAWFFTQYSCYIPVARTLRFEAFAPDLRSGLSLLERGNGRPNAADSGPRTARNPTPESENQVPWDRYYPDAVLASSGDSE